MFFFVLGFNLGLTLFNCFLVWKLWQLRGILVRVSKVLTRVERRLQRLFYPAPEYIFITGVKTYYLNQNYQRLCGQIQILQSLLFTLFLIIRYWQRQSRQRRRPLSLKLTKIPHP
jgi:hypothetical protein